MSYKKQSNCIYLCHYHLVLATKYRRKIINEGVSEFLRNRLREIEEHYPEIEIMEYNHDKDHIHILVSVPPKMSVGEVVRIIKTNTARKLKVAFPFLKKVYWGTDSVWSGSYFVSTVGISEAVRAIILREILKHIGGKKECEKTLLAFFQNDKTIECLNSIRNKYAHETEESISQNHDEAKCKFIREESRRHVQNILDLLAETKK